MHSQSQPLWGCIFFMGKRTNQKRYSTESKVDVIIDMREHRLGYYKVARMYSSNVIRYLNIAVPASLRGSDWLLEVLIIVFGG